MTTDRSSEVSFNEGDLAYTTTKLYFSARVDTPCEIKKSAENRDKITAYYMEPAEHLVAYRLDHYDLVPPRVVIEVICVVHDFIYAKFIHCPLGTQWYPPEDKIGVFYDHELQAMGPLECLALCEELLND